MVGTVKKSIAAIARLVSARIGQAAVAAAYSALNLNLFTPTPILFKHTTMRSSHSVSSLPLFRANYCFSERLRRLLFREVNR